MQGCFLLPRSRKLILPLTEETAKKLSEIRLMDLLWSVIYTRCNSGLSNLSWYEVGRSVPGTHSGIPWCSRCWCRKRTSANWPSINNSQKSPPWVGTWWCRSRNQTIFMMRVMIPQRQSNLCYMKPWVYHSIYRDRWCKPHGWICWYLVHVPWGSISLHNGPRRTKLDVVWEAAQPSSKDDDDPSLLQPSSSNLCSTSRSNILHECDRFISYLWTIYTHWWGTSVESHPCM